VMREEEIIALFQPDSHTLDDCAYLKHDGIVTTDALVEGVHFDLRYFPARALAHKLVHVNLSDLVSSGGRGSWCTLNLGLRTDQGDDFIRDFAREFRSVLGRAGIELIGGDSFRSPALFLSLTMGGPLIRSLPRSAGRAGDGLYLTGHTGLSELGLYLLQGARLRDLLPESQLSIADQARLREEAVRRHLYAEARQEWGEHICANHRIHAAMDVSDGLLSDGERLARASQLSIELETQLVADPWSLGPLVLTSGEELELLFLGEQGLTFPFPVRQIGEARDGEPGLILLNGGKPYKPAERSFEHFPRS